MDRLKVIEAGGVSIHAPAGGATMRRGRMHPTCRGFNPRARGGRDSAPRRRGPKPKAFQSTRPRGARLGYNALPVKR